MLECANTGGGKSYLLRNIVEQAACMICQKCKGAKFGLFGPTCLGCNGTGETKEVYYTEYFCETECKWCRSIRSFKTKEEADKLAERFRNSHRNVYGNRVKYRVVPDPDLG